MPEKTKKVIELWDGYEVEVNLRLADDFEFAQDLSEAERKEDLATLISLYFALVGGEKVYNDTAEHIKQQFGYFSTAALKDILARINDAFPKAGNRAQRRSWQTSK